MTKRRRRQAGEGTISEYLTKAGPRYLIKYRMPLEDGSTKAVLRRGYPTRKAAAEALGDILSEVRRGAHVLPAKMTTGEWLDQWLDGLPVTSPWRSREDLASSGRWERSQLRDLAMDAIARGLIPRVEVARSLVLLAHGLGWRSLAVGAETDHQRAVLFGFGVEAVQGKVATMPLPLDELVAWLDRRPGA